MVSQSGAGVSSTGAGSLLQAHRCGRDAILVLTGFGPLSRQSSNRCASCFSGWRYACCEQLLDPMMLVVGRVRGASRRECGLRMSTRRREELPDTPQASYRHAVTLERLNQEETSLEDVQPGITLTGRTMERATT